MTTPDHGPRPSRPDPGEREDSAHRRLDGLVLALAMLTFMVVILGPPRHIGDWLVFAVLVFFLVRWFFR